MATTVTPDEIIAALEANREWMQQPAEMREKMQPFVSALPTVLADYLPQTVTLEGVLKAKIAFLRYCLDHDMVKALFEEVKKNLKVSIKMGDQEIPVDEDAEPGLGEAAAGMMEGMMDLFNPADMLQSALETALEQLDGLVGNLKEILEENGLTDRDVLTNEKVALDGEALDLYDQGTLTFADLLRLQPMVIVKNS